MRWLLKSKIHQATVTDANKDCVGSITIDKELEKIEYSAMIVSREKITYH